TDRRTGSEHPVAASAQRACGARRRHEARATADQPGTARRRTVDCEPAIGRAVTTAHYDDGPRAHVDATDSVGARHHYRCAAASPAAARSVVRHVDRARVHADAASAAASSAAAAELEPTGDACGAEAQAADARADHRHTADRNDHHDDGAARADHLLTTLPGSTDPRAGTPGPQGCIPPRGIVVGMTDHAGHCGGAHGGHADHVAQYRRLFWWMLLLAIPTVAASGMFAMILGYTVPDVLAIRWVPPLLGTVMFVWGGRPFLTGAVSEIRSRAPGMMLLIGLAISVAFVSSWGASLGVLGHQLDFWWELALLIVIMLLGHWIEMRSLAQTSSALDSLAALLPDEAERVEGDSVETVSPAELRVGDVVVVRPGGSVPADGEIVDGAAAVDESMVTGESRPVTRSAGDRFVAGTVATDSGLRVRVTAVGDDTALAGIQRLVTEAQNSSSRAQRLADVAAGWLFWFALGSAVITAIAWGFVGQPDVAVIRVITVLVIACPHALGLAIPLVVSIATGRAARGGVLVKD